MEPPRGRLMLLAVVLLLAAMVVRAIRSSEAWSGGPDAPAAATPFVADPTSPSCDGSAGADARCGASASSSCCARDAVPAARYRRAYDGVVCTEGEALASTSAFVLDRYEVTVGRFRVFLASGGGTRTRPPAPGTGAHPRHAGSGWRAEWDESLEADAASIGRALGCGPAATWTEAPADGEDRPVNCLTWYEAFAFCAWDGGRLPTEAEWNAAAAGGAEERERPWGTSIDRSRAVFAEASPFPVGSCSPAGDGRWGHADLSGNVWEWMLDGVAGDGLLPREGASPCAHGGLPTPCDDCLAASGANRVLRSGGFGLPSLAMRPGLRRADAPTERQHVFGVRCARDVASAPAERTELVAAPDPVEAVPGHPYDALHGYLRPAQDRSVAVTLDLTSLARDPERGRVLVVRGCAWDAGFDAVATTLEAQREALAARDVAVVLVLVEGARHGQPADLIDVAHIAERLGLGYPVVADDHTGGALDGAVLLVARDLSTVVASSRAADVLEPTSPLGALLHL